MLTALFVVTLMSLALAVSMAVVAWRLVREERNRSAARIAALSAAIHGQTLPADVDRSQGVSELVRIDLAQRSGTLDRESALPVFAAEHPPIKAAALGRRADRPRAIESPSSSSILFANAVTNEPVVPAHDDVTSAAQAVAYGRYLVAGVIAASLVAVAVGIAVLSTGRSSGSETRPALTLPLELTSLSHTQDGSSLDITGRVRNPPGAAPGEQVVAVASLFDRNGDFLTSGRAPLQVATLTPGAESPFALRIENANGVARYRISFRGDGRNPIAHVDRRQTPDTTSAATRGSDGGKRP